MVDSILIGFLLFGAVAGVTALTGYPFFRMKKNYEEQAAAINAKPVAERTDEEKYLLEHPPGSFWATYKYRFGFGLIVGFGTALATIEGTLATLPDNANPLTAFVTGMTSSGFFAALANEIRSNN